MHVHLRILRIYFLRYQESSHPENFHQLNSPPLVNTLWKIPTWIISTHVFKYSRPSFLFFFSILLLLLLLHWYYLKDCFVILCFQSAEVFTFVKICQNEVLSEERQIMKWVGIFQVRIFSAAILWGKVSRGDFDGWEFFGWEFPRGGFL